MYPFKTRKAVVTAKNSFIVMFITMIFNAFYVKADSVDDFINAEMKKRNIPGLQLAIIQNNQVTKQASYGFANLEDEIKVDKETLFSINSITKAFVGVAIMQLQEENKLD